MTKDVRIAILVTLGLLAVYLANGRMIGGGDTIPAAFLQVALARGDGPFLDRFDHALREPDGRLPGHSTDKRGRAVSRYPIGPAIIAAPIALPQMLWRDWTSPGWEQDSERANRYCRQMAKVSAAMIAACAIGVLHLALRQMQFSTAIALTAAIAIGLGSGHWSMGSQALWQHGPAALCLALVIGLLTQPPQKWRWFAAGTSTALMVVCRTVDLPFALAIAIWVWRQKTPLRIWFFAPAIGIASTLASYHFYYFGALSGGYREIERMHPWAHGLKGTWTGSWIWGSLGTLVSPSHGLLIYSPWIIVAVLGAVAAQKSIPRDSLAFWLLLSLIPNFLLLAKYSCWWGGHCFGARFWIDAGPIFALALAFALDWAKTQSKILLVSLSLALAAAIAVQAVGALCYPSSWHGNPNNADRNHQRLWDWRDSELTRCIVEGLKT